MSHETLGGAVGTQRQGALLLGTVHGVAEDELGRASPEVDDECRSVPREVRPQGRDRPAEAQKGLFVAGDQAHLEPRFLEHLLDEHRAVLRVPDGARRQHRWLGRAVQSRQAGEELYGIGCHGDPGLLYAPGLVHTRPQAGRDLLPRHRQHRAVLHLADEQVDGVRAHVDDRVRSHTTSVRIPERPTYRPVLPFSYGVILRHQIIQPASRAWYKWLTGSVLI